METRPQRSPGRIRFLDAARGAAIFFMLLSHFNGAYFHDQATGLLQTLLTRIGMIASPTFTIIGGAMVGFLFATAGPKFLDLRWKLIDRGLFLLTVGHIVVTGAYLDRNPYALWTWGRTDSIAICLVIGSLAIGSMSVAARLILSGFAYAASWLAIAYWLPSTHIGSVFKELVFGSAADGMFPVLPWLAVYFVGTVVGEHMGRLLKQDQWRPAARTLMLASAGCIAALVTFKLGQYVLGVVFVPESIPWFLAYTGQKYPPGPLYLLLYSGIGFAILTAWIVAERRGFTGAVQFMAVLGRTSFFVYALQYYVFDVVRILPWRPAAAWPIVFAASCVVITLLAQIWDRTDSNRLMTVGLQWARMRYLEGLLKERPAQEATAPAA